MKRHRLAPFALIASFALAWSLPAYATGSCSNGKALYTKTTPSNSIACANSSCHGGGVNLHMIQNAAGNPGLIDQALDGPPGDPAMLGIRAALGLTSSDLDDIATYIFYGGPNNCPVSSPVLQAAPAPVTFGSTNVGSTSAPIAVTVNNNTGTASATGIGFSNSNAAEFIVSGNTCAGATVAVGNSCGFSVAFKPSTSGNRTGTLTLTYNSKTLLISTSGTGSSGVTPGQLSMPASMSLGSQNVGTTSGASSATITNIGGSAVTVSGVTSSNPSEFAIVSNTCSTVGAGASCSVSVTFKPSTAGGRFATITVTSNGTGSPQTISASGTGTSGSPQPGQLSMTNSVNAGNQAVGTTSAPNAVTVTNIGGVAVSVSSVSSSNPSEFSITNSTCATVNPSASCSFSFTFKPGSAGLRTAAFTVVSNGTGSPQTVNASGTGTSGTGPQVVTVVEYYHAAFDHYFITSIADEITKLDNGIFVGWARTGYSFKAYAAAGASTAPVCRFFSTSFAPKSSHFYTTYPGCTTLMSNPDWQFEAEVLIVTLPAGDGTCAAGLVPVYRLYNNGQGGAPNHRYTTDASIKAQMLAKNYVIEGNGPGLAFMCTPP